MDRTGSNEVRESAFQIWNEAVTSPEFPPIPIPHPQRERTVRISRRVRLENVNGSIVQFITPNRLKTLLRGRQRIKCRQHSLVNKDRGTKAA